jgi:hypothetical protein
VGHAILGGISTSAAAGRPRRATTSPSRVATTGAKGDSTAFNRAVGHQSAAAGSTRWGGHAGQIGYLWTYEESARGSRLEASGRWSIGGKAAGATVAGVVITMILVRRTGALLRREAGGLIAGAIVVGLVLAFRVPLGGTWPTGQEAYCYWIPDLADPYARSSWTQPIAYVYSPAFLQAIALLKVLPWEAFLATWTAILLLAIRYLSGARLWAVAIAFAILELLGGNIHLLLAVAIVAGFRWPAAWAFVLLTKVTPGVGLLWFAVRREWRNLGIALAATAAVVAVSWSINPGAWADWIDVLAASTTKTVGTWAALPVPVWVRLPFAAAVVVWGARTDRAWTVPVAAMLALPALWFGGASMLLAAVALASGRVPGAAPPPSSGSGRLGLPWRMRRAALPVT